MAVSDLYKHYSKLKRSLTPLFFADYSADNIYQCHLVAAFSKSFEFNLLVNKDTDLKNAFFYTPSLRGICEDLITLQFIKKHKTLDKDKLLQAHMLLQMIETVETQKTFFSKNHPQQIVFTFPETEKAKAEQLGLLKKEWAKIGLNKDKLFPSTSHMATDAGLFELYDYLYSATSDMVHFSPHNLLRSGWSKKETPLRHHFSPLNFYKYYSLFNRFYGSYLFIKFCTLFKKELQLSKTILAIIKELENDLFLNSRWPELVTFEEMNVAGANEIRFVNLMRKLELTLKNKDGSLEDLKKIVGEIMEKGKKAKK